MELTINHLAPYLPYGLKLQITNGHLISNRAFELDCGHDFHNLLANGSVKPILRPLSDLKDYLIDDDISLFRKLSIRSRHDFQYEKPSILKWSFEDVTILLENHFDVFGLIEKGLALDINTLNQ